MLFEFPQSPAGSLGPAGPEPGICRTEHQHGYHEIECQKRCQNIYATITQIECRSILSPRHRLSDKMSEHMSQYMSDRMAGYSKILFMPDCRIKRQNTYYELYMSIRLYQIDLWNVRWWLLFL